MIRFGTQIQLLVHLDRQRQVITRFGLHKLLKLLVKELVKIQIHLGVQLHPIIRFGILPTLRQEALFTIPILSTAEVRLS